jgi:hypothetical protein
MVSENAENIVSYDEAVNKIHEIRSKLNELGLKKHSLPHEECERISNDLGRVEIFLKNFYKDEYSKLKEDYEQLKGDYQIVKDQLVQANNKISKLEAEVFNIKVANKMADAFSYFRDYVIKVERKENIQKYPNLHLKDPNEILAALSPPQVNRADNDEDIARKQRLRNNTEAASVLIQNLSMSVDLVTSILKLKQTGNDNMHFIDKERYGDRDYMQFFLGEVTADIELLRESHEYFDKKDSLKQFTTMLSMLVEDYSSPNV